jgi:hypothetical protein
MPTRRKIPMVGDTPPETVVVPLEEAGPHAVLSVPRTEVSSFEDAREFDWEAYSDLIIACLIVPKSIDHLVDYWKANSNMLDWAKKVKPDVFEKIRSSFTDRRKQLERG